MKRIARTLGRAAAATLAVVSACGADAVQRYDPSFAIELPDAARAAGSVELCIRDTRGERALREQRAVHPDSAMLPFDLPPSWHDAGTYEVAVALDGKEIARLTITAPPTD